MVDVLQQLQRLSWRDIEVPITSRNVSFDQDQTAHKLVYRDNHLIEALGAGNLRFKYGVPMRQDIARGPYKNLFVVVLPALLRACRDRSAGPLVDPIYGAFRAKCVTFSDTLDMNRRDGTDIEVEFIHAPELGATDALPEQISGISALGNEAGALDAALAKIEWGQEPPPEPFADLLGQIDGMLRQLDRYQNKIAAALDRVAFGLEKVEASLTKLGDPKNAPITRSARRLRGSVRRVKEALNATPGKLQEYVLQTSMTLATLAQTVGVDLEDLLALNASIAKTPFVLAGTRITVAKG